jgi:DNA-binding NarL/FixJ family response regulator
LPDTSRSQRETADSLARPPAAIAAELSPAASTLTRRELEVLQLLASVIPNKEIAARLGMATKTTMHHTSKIYSKLGVRGRGEAAAWARRAGIV